MRNINKTSSPPRLVALLAGVALLGLASQNALAVSATSGTVITNQATLSYSVSGVGQPNIASSAANFVVDKKIDVLVSELGTTAHATVPGQLASSGGSGLNFTVTNLGNDPQDFSLATSQPIGGTIFTTLTDSYDSTNCSAFIDANGNKIFDAGEATFIDELAPGASQAIVVTCDTPLATVNGDVSIIAMTATALVGGTPGAQGGALPADAGASANTAGVDIVYADAAGTDDIAHDAKSSWRDAYLVGTATLTVTKTATLLCDPVHGNGTPHHIPGATVRYVISISNAAGSAAATLASISDVIDANLSHDANLVTAASNCVTPESIAGSGFKVTVLNSTRVGFPKYFTTATDGDAVGIAADNVTITAAIASALPVEAGYATAGELKAGETMELSFNVIIK